MEHFVALWLVAAMGGLAARRLGLPGGTLLGALLGTALFTVVNTQAAALPSALTAVIQAFVGIMLGLGVDRGLLAVLRAHRRLISATAVLTAGIWAVMAVAAAATGLLDASRAVLGSAPAGPAVSLLVSQQGIALGTISLLLVLRVALVGSVLSVYLKVRGHPLARIVARRVGSA